MLSSKARWSAVAATAVIVSIALAGGAIWASQSDDSQVIAEADAAPQSTDVQVDLDAWRNRLTVRSPHGAVLVGGGQYTEGENFEPVAQAVIVDDGAVRSLAPLPLQDGQLFVGTAGGSTESHLLVVGLACMAQGAIGCWPEPDTAAAFLYDWSSGEWTRLETPEGVAGGTAGAVAPLAGGLLVGSAVGEAGFGGVIGGDSWRFDHYDPVAAQWTRVDEGPTIMAAATILTDQVCATDDAVYAVSIPDNPAMESEVPMELMSLTDVAGKWQTAAQLPPRQIGPPAMSCSSDQVLLATTQHGGLAPLVWVDGSMREVPGEQLADAPLHGIQLADADGSWIAVGQRDDSGVDVWRITSQGASQLSADSDVRVSALQDVAWTSDGGLVLLPASGEPIALSVEEDS